MTMLCASSPLLPDVAHAQNARPELPGETRAGQRNPVFAPASLVNNAKYLGARHGRISSRAGIAAKNHLRVGLRDNPVNRELARPRDGQYDGTRL
jgi:hypothetical protein